MTLTGADGAYDWALLHRPRPCLVTEQSNSNMSFQQSMLDSSLVICKLAYMSMLL